MRGGEDEKFSFASVEFVIVRDCSGGCTFWRGEERVLYVGWIELLFESDYGRVLEGGREVERSVNRNQPWEPVEGIEDVEMKT